MPPKKRKRPGGHHVRLVDRPPQGQPSPYKQEFDKIAEDILSQGKSIAAVAAKLDVCKATVYNWAKNNKSFLDAIKRGNAKAECYYEEMARENIVTNTDSKFNTGPWTFIMKNRFGWVDKTEVKQDTNITITVDPTQADEVLDLAIEDLPLLKE